MGSFLSEDAEQFCRVALWLAAAKRPLRETAAHVQLPPSELNSLFARLAENGDPVVETTDEEGEIFVSLTTAGHGLLDRIQAFATPPSASSTPTLRLLISQTMITSGVVDRMLKSLPKLPDMSFQLETQVPRRFSELVAQIESGVVSCALVWGTTERLSEVPESLRVEVVVPSVDVVIVAHERRIVEGVNPLAHWFNSQAEANQGTSDAIERAVTELAAHRYAALPPQTQPAAKLLPSRSGADPNRTEVDTIDTALMLVRCGAVDFAILPAIYDRLEREEQDGNLVYSEPIAHVPIVAVFPHKAPSQQRGRLEHLLSELRLDESASMWRSRRTPTDKFPRSVSFYTKLRYGYYIGAEVGELESPLQWCWESIKLFGDSKRRRRTLQGTIINQFGNQFEITSAQFRETFLIARVKPVGRGKKHMREFFSRFHYCDYKSGIICGTWSGNVGEERAGVFATVWSQSRLDLRELTRVMRNADLHSVMSAGVGCENKEDQQDLTSDVVAPIRCDDSLHRLSDLVVDDESDVHEKEF